ncbi:hypothetical protein BDV95DRAFT_305970 [Massariosphaeria phaeospora]|uniref:Uncharacterized protein n=1 Tax=Massariosphaeria phaeospora TaxID=100035 RepID=A0A7C8IB23_9PLEO|nr:hypothetical protein BDV95DRAFT_305970 [Massariosphaeria phaeospora]
MKPQDCITTLLPEYLPTESGLPTATYFLDTIRCMRTSFYEWQVNCTRGPRDPMDYYIAVGEVLDKYESLVYQGTVDWDNFCLDLDEVEKGNWSGSKSHGMRLDRYFAEDDAMEDVELSSRGKSRAWKVKAEGMDKDCAPGSAKRKRTKT